jgi:hypothetical protein
MGSKPKKRGGKSGSGNLGNIPDIRDMPDLRDMPDVPDVRDMRDMRPMRNLRDMPDMPDMPDLPHLEAATAGPTSNARLKVNARDGLRLRSGPDLHFPAVRTLPLGTVVAVLKREGVWAQVDLEGDGVADGFVHGSFLEPASAGSAGGPAGGEGTVVVAGNDVLDTVTPAMVKSIFPSGTSLANIKNNLPSVLDGLRGQGLVDKPMVLMALATIRAETEGFEPISEFKSRFNTLNTPFDLYDAGTSKGRALGNTERGDGPFFKGRGFVQLTGRFNYTLVGRQLGQPLATQPELANDPAVAGAILARFLKNKEGSIRAALAASNLTAARRGVNGGSHGLDRFTETFNRGLTVLPD